MKKVVLIVLIALAAGFTSCNKAPEQPEDPMLPGKHIFSMTSYQNNMAFQLADVAFRLNVLMAEAKSQDITDLNTVKVRGDNLKDALFGYGIVEAGVDGMYKIKFRGDYYDNRVVDGTYIVETSGLLLEELEPGGSWAISVERNGSENFQYREANLLGGYTVINLSNDITYSIAAGNTEATWDISFNGHKLQTGNYPESDWSGDFTVKQAVGSGFTFDVWMASVFEIHGHSFGKTVYGNEMEYWFSETDPVKYYMACTRSRVQAGGFKAAFAGSQEVNSGDYPSRFVEINYTKLEGDCNTECTITYNGQTAKW